MIMVTAFEDFQTLQGDIDNQEELDHIGAILHASSGYPKDAHPSRWFKGLHEPKYTDKFEGSTDGLIVLSLQVGTYISLITHKQ